VAIIVMTSETLSRRGIVGARARRVVHETLEFLERLRLEQSDGFDEYFFECLNDCAQSVGADDHERRMLALLFVQLAIEGTNAGDYERRDEIIGWICTHVARERVTVKVSTDDQLLIVEFPDQCPVM
jgi:hypothetical protein